MIKKASIALSTVFMLFILISCAKGSNSIVISKYYQNTYMSENAIELYNTSDKEVNLKGYSLNIYTDTDKSVTYSYKITGKIAPKGFFLIATSDPFDVELQNADFKVDKLPYNGDDAIVLARGKQNVDVLGTPGSGVVFGEKTTLVRKKSRMEASTIYDSTSFFYFKESSYQLLGTIETGILDEDLFTGPMLTDEDRQRPFFKEGDRTVGGGGAVKVTISRLGDGDTTRFNFPEELFGSSDKSVRYYFINTPESPGHPSESPWGLTAKNFNNSILNQAVELGLDIEIQSGLDGTTDGGFDRLFAMVYVGGYQLNYMIAKAGLCPDVTEQAPKHGYKGMSYYGWMIEALNYAKTNKLGMHGDQLDPSWNYEKNTSRLDSNYFPEYDRPYLKNIEG
ncbi:lamin tail domain-containing protein [Haploplasma axanthum]|uniref:LTD domain-containing protein n=1 Tax=Haploplasma axanthum TaxID=29552 RepID=A0A449BC86_HAPAX|nr:lamin tail domain-containing protein [Haploplasma axanthum]VEU80053.1 Uncharacterised protein [Haploplasma axanthum]